MMLAPISGMAPGLSHPQLMTKFNNGHIMDDYRESYWWLRSNTPEELNPKAEAEAKAKAKTKAHL